jgi:hypothetical protein
MLDTCSYRDIESSQGGVGFDRVSNMPHSFNSNITHLASGDSMPIEAEVSRLVARYCCVGIGLEIIIVRRASMLAHTIISRKVMDRLIFRHSAMYCAPSTPISLHFKWPVSHRPGGIHQPTSHIGAKHTPINRFAIELLLLRHSAMSRIPCTPRLLR